MSAPSWGRDDHAIRQAMYGLLRLELPEEVSGSMCRQGKNPHAAYKPGPIIDAIANAITGRPWSSAQGVEALTEAQADELFSVTLPALGAALTAHKETMARAIADAYYCGVRDGSDLLSKLASGTASVDEFNRKTTGGGS